MQRNNIKRHAVAAFRYYAQHTLGEPEGVSADDVITIAAVASTLRHLRFEHKAVTLDIVRSICFELPPGDLPRGEISGRVKTAAEKLNTSDSYVWGELRRACGLFDDYYREFTPRFSVVTS